MHLYDQFRSVPAEAKKTISGGRLNGKTDINPMWRIKALTEAFGPCGTGWWFIIREKRLEPGADGEVSAFVDIDLYYQIDGKTSQPIPGTGGSAFVAKERSGPYTSDECFKMALTDAISVACKALGVGADVYWDKDNTKYTKGDAPAEKPILCSACKKPIEDADGKTAAQIVAGTKKNAGKVMCLPCFKQFLADEKAAMEASGGST